MLSVTGGGVDCVAAADGCGFRVEGKYWAPG